MDDFMLKVQRLSEGTLDPSEQSQTTKRRCVATSADMACAAPTVGVGLPALTAQQPVNICDELSKLIAWRSAGHLSDAEFVKAKCGLALN